MSKYPFYQAKYIKAQETPSEFSLYDPIPLFRREFELTEDIREARIFVQSPGFAEYYINGKRITDDIFISAVSDYGKILCRCEQVSEGEIRTAIRRNPPAFDIDSVKRRTRSGMGRCQGGFCMPYVMRLIAEEHGIKMEDVTKSGPGSNPLTGKL